jgi:hypothetical protein
LLLPHRLLLAEHLLLVELLAGGLDLTGGVAEKRVLPIHPSACDKNTVMNASTHETQLTKSAPVCMDA